MKVVMSATTQQLLICILSVKKVVILGYTGITREIGGGTVRD